MDTQRQRQSNAYLTNSSIQKFKMSKNITEEIRKKIITTLQKARIIRETVHLFVGFCFCLFICLIFTPQLDLRGDFSIPLLCGTHRHIQLEVYLQITLEDNNQIDTVSMR